MYPQDGIGCHMTDPYYHKSTGRTKNLSMLLRHSQRKSIIVLTASHLEISEIWKFVSAGGKPDIIKNRQLARQKAAMIIYIHEKQYKRYIQNIKAQFLIVEVKSPWLYPPGTTSEIWHNFVFIFLTWTYIRMYCIVCLPPLHLTQDSSMDHQ